MSSNVKKSSGFPPWLLVAGGGVLLLLCGGGAGAVAVVWLKYSAVVVNRTETTRQEVAGENTVDEKPTATFRNEVEIHNAYGDNPVDADLKYTGKKIEIQVVRGKLNKDREGRYYFGGETASPRRNLTAPEVICFFGPEESKRLAPMKPGQAIKISGICRGRSVEPGAWKGYSVTLDKCRLIALLSYRDNKWAEE